MRAHRTRAQPDRPKPRRRPIVDQARTAGWELRKAVDRVDRILADDRFPRHREEVIIQLRAALEHAEDVLSDANIEADAFEHRESSRGGWVDLLDSARADRAKRVR